MPLLNIVLASVDGRVEEGVRRAFDKTNRPFTITCVDGAPSLDVEPRNERTAVAAKARLAMAIDAIPNADLYISAQRGVFFESMYWKYRYVVCVGQAGIMHTDKSEAFMLNVADVNAAQDPYRRDFPSIEKVYIERLTAAMNTPFPRIHKAPGELADETLHGAARQVDAAAGIAALDAWCRDSVSSLVTQLLPGLTY